jgi:hypothetical protein
MLTVEVGAGVRDGSLVDVGADVSVGIPGEGSAIRDGLVGSTEGVAGDCCKEGLHAAVRSKQRIARGVQRVRKQLTMNSAFAKFVTGRMQR